MSRALLSSILVSAALTALAPAAAARPGNAPVQHDRGFFMRLSAGAGYGSATVDDGQDTKFSGFAGTASFAFGGTIMRNFALHADFFGLSMFEPKFESGGVSGTVQDTTARFFGFGVGVTGYVMPANVYFSGSLGAGIASLQFRPTRPARRLRPRPRGPPRRRSRALRSATTQPPTRYACPSCASRRRRPRVCGRRLSRGGRLQRQDDVNAPPQNTGRVQRTRLRRPCEARSVGPNRPTRPCDPANAHGANGFPTE